MHTTGPTSITVEKVHFIVADGSQVDWVKFFSVYVILGTLLRCFYRNMRSINSTSYAGQSMITWALAWFGHTITWPVMLFFSALQTLLTHVNTELFVTLNLSDIDLIDSWFPRNHNVINKCFSTLIGSLPPCCGPVGSSGQFPSSTTSCSNVSTEMRKWLRNSDKL